MRLTHADVSNTSNFEFHTYNQKKAQSCCLVCRFGIINRIHMKKVDSVCIFVFISADVWKILRWNKSKNWIKQRKERNVILYRLIYVLNKQMRAGRNQRISEIDIEKYSTNANNSDQCVIFTRYDHDSKQKCICSIVYIEYIRLSTNISYELMLGRIVIFKSSAQNAI